MSIASAARVASEPVGEASSPTRSAARAGWPELAAVVGAYAVVVAAWLARQSTLRWPNNYFTFRTAARNLLAARDLYVAYPASHYDLYKYSPSFALLFWPFAALPAGASIVLWTAVSTVAFVLAVYRLVGDERSTAMVLALTGWAFFQSVRGAQTNAIVAACMIAAFLALEARRPARAALAIVLGAVIKLFPLAVLPMALTRRVATRAALWCALLGAAAIALPLAAVPRATLAIEYASWARVAHLDALDRGTSVMLITHDWLGLPGPNWPVQLAGTLLLVAPILLRRDRWRDPMFRRRVLASILIYAVLFNHKAEYQGYIIATTGAALWYCWSRRTRVHLAWSVVTTFALHPLAYLVSWLALETELLVGGGPVRQSGHP